MRVVRIKAGSGREWTSVASPNKEGMLRSREVFETIN